MTTTITEKDSRLIEAAHELRPLVEQYADQLDKEQKLAQPLLDAIVKAGLFKMLVPEDYGGSEASPETFTQVLEEISSVDGSTGWCVCFPANNGIASAYFQEDAAREIFGGKMANTAGTGVSAAQPEGQLLNQAVAVNGGFQVTGRWSYASGCMQATWLFGSAAVYEGDSPRVTPEGWPERRTFYIPKEDCEIIRNWNGSGLRGTGSNDFTVTDVFVPEEHTRLLHLPPESSHGNNLYKFGPGELLYSTAGSRSFSPWGTIAPIALASVCLGIARGALEDFIMMAGVKRDRGGQVLLKHNSAIQDRVGRAQANLDAARAYLFDTLRKTWLHILESGEHPQKHQQLVRQTSVHASVLSAKVVDSICEMSGATAIVTSGPFDRRFRDIRAALANRVIGVEHYATSGRLILGQDTPD